MLEHSPEKKLSLSDLPTADVLKEGFALLNKCYDFDERFGLQPILYPGGFTIVKVNPNQPDPTIEDYEERDRCLQEIAAVGDVLIGRRDLGQVIEEFVQRDLQNDPRDNLERLRMFYDEQLVKIIRGGDYL